MMRLKNGNKSQILRLKLVFLTAKMIFLHKMLADILNLHAKIRIIYQMWVKSSRFGKLSSILLVKDFVYKYCICQKNILPLRRIHISNLQRDNALLCKKAIKYDFWMR